MPRPKAKELTERELEVMHIFWQHGEMTTADVQEKLATGGRDLAYTTVATLVKILLEKNFLKQTHDERPFRFKPAKSFQEVSGNIVSDLIERVFAGSREQLLVHLVEDKKLTKKERKLLEDIIRNTKQQP